MKCRTNLKSRQGGAVAVMVGISMVALIGFLAIVIDLGHLYITKTELQNAADAAALAGAKELNGTAAGVSNAIGWVEAVASKNNYDFSSKPVAVTADDLEIRVCSTPDNCEYLASAAAADNSNVMAAGRYFLKVETKPRVLPVWFASIWGLMNISTYGVAVAGQYSVEITPIAMCAIDVTQCPCLNPSDGVTCDQGNKLCGYEPGKSYHLTGVGGVNPIGAGTPLWVDATATQSNPTCNGNVPDFLPFVCQGKTYISTKLGDLVYTNTGGSYGPQFAALDSRFGDTDPQGQCNPATALPDRNVREFAYQLFADLSISGQNPYKKQVKIPDWMTPSPDPAAATPQTSRCTSIGTDPYGGNRFDCPWSQNGVYWSAASGVAASPATSGVGINSNYPASGTPYTQTSGSYFEHKNGPEPLPGRRLLNMFIVQCEAAGGICRPARTRMVGQFLLQTRASVANQVNVEFVRTVTVSPNGIHAEIRLYR